MNQNERILSVLRAPHISEKSARLQEHNQYVFEVAQDANKADVKAAVEDLFNVKVDSVNVVNTKGKIKFVPLPCRHARKQAQGIRAPCRRPHDRRVGQGLR